MSRTRGEKGKARKEDGFVRVRRSNLEKITTEVMRLRGLVPGVLNGNMTEIVRQARIADTKRLLQDKKHLRQECLYLHSQLDAAQTECQKEREEKLLLHEQLWQSRAELQQQAAFCSGLGSAACTLLWSSSTMEHTIMHWLTDGKMQSFLIVAAQTLEGFVRSLDGEVRLLTEDHNCLEHQFVLALAGIITNIAAVPCGRDFLCSWAIILLDTLMMLLELMTPGIFPRLRALMLIALYNVSVSIKGLRYISQNPGLVPLIKKLLNDGDWEVCFHSLRLLQSLMMEGEIVHFLGPSLLDPDIQARVSQLTTVEHPFLSLAARQTLDDLHGLHSRE